MDSNDILNLISRIPLKEWLPIFWLYMQKEYGIYGYGRDNKTCNSFIVNKEGIKIPIERGILR